MSEEFICTICGEDIDAKGGLPWQVEIAGHTLIVCYDCFKKKEEKEKVSDYIHDPKSEY